MDGGGRRLEFRASFSVARGVIPTYPVDMNIMTTANPPTSLLPDAETMYRALLRRDASYEGLFVVAVKTTGVFCRSTCTARKPKRENVEFFPSPREALQYGYRPCRLCRPLEMKGAAPGWLGPLLEEIEANPDLRLPAGELRRRGLEPGRVRRWFQRHFGMSFAAWLRALRVGRAFGRIRRGDKVIDAAFDTGYESLSGFTESFKRTTGFPPSDGRTRSLLVMTRILTPFGPMVAGAVEGGICLFEFADRRMLATQMKRLRRHFDTEPVLGTHPLLDQLRKEIAEYFDGTRTRFDVPLAPRGTPFQMKVWEGLRTIPYGTVRSYAEQAERLGMPKAVRAVAKANGDNGIAILIPCHRVVGSDGKLTGYGGGLWRKKYLLDLEQKHKG